jgi:peptidoglycan/xylan/chitin deacetylase (PgdA/CDA1 family)
VRAGHEIGNHSWDHRRLAGQPLKAFRQLRATSRAVSREAGVRPAFFRPPYRALGGGLIQAARLAGLTTLTWDVDSRDWELGGAEAIYEEVVAAVRPGSIVLMHDGGGRRQHTLEALALIVPALRERGYDLVTTSRLLGR